jgi:pimeloyl-ACP methyl ester carboxylesterase
MRFKTLPFALVGFSVAAFGCAEDGVLGPDPEPTLLQKRAITGPQEVEGATGPGSLYKLFYPAVWNGDLVIYSHGYVAPGEPIALPEVDPLPATFNAFGYGVAYSSFSENGYAIKDAVQRTRQLRGIFASRFGMPNRTYLVGHSEGALISLMLAEKNPKLFDGALAMCGPMGGGPLQVEYLLNLRVLFDYFYPGVIPGTVFEIPQWLDFDAHVVPAVTLAISTNLAPAIEMTGVDQLEIQYVSIPELIGSILSGLYYNIVGTEDLLGRTHGRIMAGNMDTEYTGSFNDEALNAGVQRYEATPDAANYVEHWYQPSGKLAIPVVTLHTTRDGAVPFFHEAAYAELVLAAGSSDMLLQLPVNRFGHCAFTVPEQVGAFLALKTWVETGFKPTP